jgi:hypothetical protein
MKSSQEVFIIKPAFSGSGSVLACGSGSRSKEIDQN